jgi:hypothetical protein
MSNKLPYAQPHLSPGRLSVATWLLATMQPVMDRLGYSAE